MFTNPPFSEASKFTLQVWRVPEFMSA